MHDKPVLLTYVPHGSNPKYFYPIDQTSPDWNDFNKFKDDFYKKNGNPEFVILFNNRNIRRKSPGDVILSYKRFCDGLPKDKAKKCCLVMKTSLVDDNGTDLMAVKRAICPDHRVVFIDSLLETKQMNWLYNITDCLVFLSSAEGFGLASNEFMMVGNGIVIAPVTGGLQDQMRFCHSPETNPVSINSTFTTNHRGRYSTHGEWCIPLVPSARVLNGSPATPFIFDDFVDAENVAEAIDQAYNMSIEERKRRGQSGRSWVLSQESNMSSPVMCEKFVTAMNTLFDTWKSPANKWEFLQINERPVPKNSGIMWRQGQ